MGSFLAAGQGLGAAPPWLCFIAHRLSLGLGRSNVDRGRACLSRVQSVSPPPRPLPTTAHSSPRLAGRGGVRSVPAPLSLLSYLPPFSACAHQCAASNELMRPAMICTHYFPVLSCLPPSLSVGAFSSSAASGERLGRAATSVRPPPT